MHGAHIINIIWNKNFIFKNKANQCKILKKTNNNESSKFKSITKK
jgi:hypothetical protein